MSEDGLFAVNWKNPMRLSEEHFRTADRLAAQARTWLARATSFPVGGYGLVPPSHGGGKALSLTHDHGPDRLIVTVHSIAALAPDGTPLIFDETTFPELHGRLRVDIALEPRPGTRRLGVLIRPIDLTGLSRDADIELGEPDGDEEPPRRPFRVPALEAAIDTDAFSAGSALKVAEYLWDGVDLRPAPDFFPPCLTVSAWPDLARCVTNLRGDVQKVRRTLAAAADNEASSAPSQIEPLVLPMLAAVAALEDGLPERTPRIHPYTAWDTALRVLRVSQVLIGAHKDVLDNAIRNLVQPGKLSSGNTFFFEDLDRFLASPYDHDNVGQSLAAAQALLVGVHEVLRYLSGVAQEVAPPTTGYLYKGRRFRFAEYHTRQATIDGPWHACRFADMELVGPKSLLLVCDRALLVENPRNNAGLWMVDKAEKVLGNMWKVDIDTTSDPSKVVVHYVQIGEPTVTAVSIASSGLLDFGGLAPEPDEKLRIYVEE